MEARHDDSCVKLCEKQIRIIVKYDMENIEPELSERTRRPSFVWDTFFFLKNHALMSYLFIAL